MQACVFEKESLNDLRPLSASLLEVLRKTAAYICDQYFKISNKNGPIST